nr:hypothetical protein OG461_05470 [Streptomyces sp. NBC_00995]
MRNAEPGTVPTLGPGPLAATAFTALPDLLLTALITSAFLTLDALAPAGTRTEAYAWLIAAVGTVMPQARPSRASCQPARPPPRSRPPEPSPAWEYCSAPAIASPPRANRVPVDDTAAPRPTPRIADPRGNGSSGPASPSPNNPPLSRHHR